MQQKVLSSPIIVLFIAFLLESSFLPAQSLAQFTSMPTVTTTATFVDPQNPSSSNNTFSVRLLATGPIEIGQFTFRECLVSGLPADGAVNVGNCQWAEFVDGEFRLVLVRFNWQVAGTNAVWGQFCLLNDLGTGNWVRFVTPDGMAASVVGSASGPLSYQEDGPPSGTFTGRWEGLTSQGLAVGITINAANRITQLDLDYQQLGEIPPDPTCRHAIRAELSIPITSGGTFSAVVSVPPQADASGERLVVVFDGTLSGMLSGSQAMGTWTFTQALLSCQRTPSSLANNGCGGMFPFDAACAEYDFSYTLTRVE